MFAASLYKYSANEAAPVLIVVEAIMLIFGLIMTFKAYSRGVT
jgi:hypothetical protein